MTLPSVEVTDAIEIRSGRSVYGGSDDYSRDVTNVVAIVDARGRTHTPVWGDAWTTLASGIDTIHEGGQNRVRISSVACPVLVEFRDLFEYVSYSDSDHNERTTELRWTAYVRPGTLLSTHLILRLRRQLAEWRGWSPGKAFRRLLLDLRRE